jgi:hypothetical protein
MILALEFQEVIIDPPVRAFVNNMIKRWKRVVDNKMRWYGDIDYDKRIIRVNKSSKKNKKMGDIINTIVHEETHRLHPKMYERNVKKFVVKKLNRMGKKQKQKLYSKYR